MSGNHDGFALTVTIRKSGRSYDWQVASPTATSHSISPIRSVAAAHAKAVAAAAIMHEALAWPGLEMAGLHILE